jgi:hypothetical protein
MLASASLLDVIGTSFLTLGVHMLLFPGRDDASGRAKRARTDEEGNDNQDDSEGGDDAETPAIKRRVMPVRKPAPQGRLLPVALKRTGCCCACAILPRLLLVKQHGH